MKSWIRLFVLACLAVTQPAAAGTIRFHGLDFEGKGGAVADLDASGRLQVSNIGSSGQDGVSVSCPHANGMRMCLDGSTMPSDAGASVEMKYYVVGLTHRVQRYRRCASCAPPATPRSTSTRRSSPRARARRSA